MATTTLRQQPHSHSRFAGCSMDYTYRFGLNTGTPVLYRRRHPDTLRYVLSIRPTGPTTAALSHTSSSSLTATTEERQLLRIPLRIPRFFPAPAALAAPKRGPAAAAAPAISKRPMPSQPPTPSLVILEISLPPLQLPRSLLSSPQKQALVPAYSAHGWTTAVVLDLPTLLAAVSTILHPRASTPPTYAEARCTSMLDLPAAEEGVKNFVKPIAAKAERLLFDYPHAHVEKEQAEGEKKKKRRGWRERLGLKRGSGSEGSGSESEGERHGHLGWRERRRLRKMKAA